MIKLGLWCFHGERRLVRKLLNKANDYRVVLCLSSQIIITRVLYMKMSRFLRVMPVEQGGL